MMEIDKDKPINNNTEGDNEEESIVIDNNRRKAKPYVCRSLLEDFEDAAIVTGPSEKETLAYLRINRDKIGIIPTQLQEFLRYNLDFDGDEI